MNKAALIDYVADKAGLSKAAAQRAVEAVFGGIVETLKRGESVSIVGFGTFSVVERAPRKARNPRTGEEVQVPAMKAPKFKAGKTLKEAVK